MSVWGSTRRVKVDSDVVQESTWNFERREVTAGAFWIISVLLWKHPHVERNVLQSVEHHSDVVAGDSQQ